MCSPLEQQEQLPNATVPQDQLSNSSRSSSSSSSSSTRVDMTGDVIPTGSLSRHDSTNLASNYDDDDDDSELEEEFLVDFPLEDDRDHHHHHHDIRPSPHHPRQKKRVSFDSIDIREYSRCLQVHPSTAQGPPIGIDWNYEEVGTFNLEEFETNRENTSHIRRRRWSFLMPAKVREALLIDNGHTEEEMEAAVTEVRKSQQQRRESFEAQEFEDWLLMKEACKRRFRRWKTGVSKKREQELLWESAATRMGQAQKIQQPMSLTSKAA